MGEYADMLIDSMIDGNERWGFPQPLRGRRRALVKTCGYCGETDLRWGNISGGKWRLKTTTGELHVCPSYSRSVIESFRTVKGSI